MTGAPAEEAVPLIVMIPRLSRSVKSDRGPTYIAYNAPKLFTLPPLLKFASPATKNVPAAAYVCVTEDPVLTVEPPSPKDHAMALAVTPEGSVSWASNVTGCAAVAKTVTFDAQLTLPSGVTAS